MTDRREIIKSMILTGSMAGFLPALAAGAADAKPLKAGLAYSLDLAADNVELYARLTGRPNQRQTFILGRGSVYGIDPSRGELIGEFGKHLFDVESCQIKLSRISADSVLTDRSRSWMLYRDVETGAYLTSFKNPYTGRVVDVPQFKGRVSGTTVAPAGLQYAASFPMESSAFGKPYILQWSLLGDVAVAKREAFTRWQDPRNKEYRTEMTLDTWSFPMTELENRSESYIPNVPSWMSETGWMGFLGMDSHPGHMLWRTDSRLLDSTDALPAEFIDASKRLLGKDILADISWN